MKNKLILMSIKIINTYYTITVVQESISYMLESVEDTITFLIV